MFSSRLFPAQLLLLVCCNLQLARAELTPYSGPPPELPPNRVPFSYGSLATGGAGADASSIFLVDNMPDLRTALELDRPRTVYVQGNIAGNEITAGANGSTFADCQWYIDDSPVKQFNFTRYVMSLNESFMESVKAESQRGGTIEGMNATEFELLLKEIQSVRSRVQNSQKKWESIDAKSDLTLIGMDENAHLNGVSMIFNNVSNVIIRNLKMTPPEDCFPSPESPTAWNARYDAMSLVTSTNFWIDGNILADRPDPITPEPLVFGLQVDRYDGLMDCEDGTDNITFSHNIVANHHKALLLGGGLKERDRSLGKMHFMIFGNWFQNSRSRNPMMRFGTFYIMNNLYTFDNVSATSNKVLENNLGVLTESTVLVGGNVFQNAVGNNGESRIFGYSALSSIDTPARLCIPHSETNLPEGLQGLGGPSSLNGLEIDLKADALATFARAVAGLADSVIDTLDSVINGTLLVGCEGFAVQEVPATFPTTAEVELYVRQEAGQIVAGGCV